MRCVVRVLLMSCAVLCAGCGADHPAVTETKSGFLIPEGTRLRLVLDTELSSNANKRLDAVEAHLKSALALGDNVVVAQGTAVRGLVKQVDDYREPGDRAALVIIFDQLVTEDGSIIPISARLDTRSGSAAIKVEGKALRDARIMSQSTLAGAMIGKETLAGQGLEKGIAIGAGLGSSAIFLSDAKEIRLPSGSEFVVVLDESVEIPRAELVAR